MLLLGKAFPAPTSVSLPLFLSPVSAGFPSPADDYLEKRLDLNDLLVSHSAATFVVRAEGESMQGIGIYSGDLLIVDRSLNPFSGAIVVATINGEFLVKRFEKRGAKAFLVSENIKFKTIELSEEGECLIWGVVTYAIRNLTRK